MKLLYLDVCAQYMNPTASLLPQLMLAVSPDTRFYGPGFSTPDDLALGVRRWVDANGPFDAVVVGPQVPFFTIADPERRAGIAFISRYTVHPPLEPAVLRRYFDDVLEALGRLPIGLKIVTSLALDSYVSTDAQVARVLETGVVLLGPNHQLLQPLANWPQDALREDRHYAAKRHLLSDVWLRFLETYPERVITACHYVADHEFCATSLAARRWDIAVPGVEYAFRRAGLASLRSAAFRVAPKRYFHLFRVANRLGLPVHRHHVTARLFKQWFEQTLRDSRMVFTAPGASGIILRKFVEIPAAGAALLCLPCNGFRALGFEAGRHYLDVRPAALRDAVAAHRDDAGLQAIADAGRRLVLAQHSLRARAGQIGACLQALARGSYRGAEWHEGSFAVQTADAEVGAR